MSSTMTVDSLQACLMEKFHQKTLQDTNTLKKQNDMKTEKMLFFIDDLNIGEQKECGQHQAVYEYIRQLNSEGKLFL